MAWRDIAHFVLAFGNEFIFKQPFFFVFQIVVPPLPSKALKRQLPFRNDDGIYEEGFIEDRRSGLESFVNK